MVKLDISWLTFVAGTVIPLLTALVTKARASSRLKSLVTLALSVLGGAVTYLLDNNGTVQAQALISNVVTTYLAAGVTYNNLWKPTGIAPALAATSAESGIGVAVEDPDAPKRISTYLDVEPEPSPPLLEEIEVLDDENDFVQVEEYVPRHLTSLKGEPVFVDATGYLFVESPLDSLD